MRPPGRPDRGSRGFALVLAIGALTLLVLLGLSLQQLVRLVSAGSGSRSGTCASLAAESGMEYGAARLAREGYPLSLHVPENRGDDWTFREPPGAAGLPDPEESKNPSYSHGEPWTDDGDGRFSAAGDSADADLDGDGRFSAWTGRLRGKSVAADRFALRIGSTASRLPVNAGFLDTADRNGNGVPDCRDLRPTFFPVHTGLAHTLNNLGAIVWPDGHPRTWSIATSNPIEPIDYSLFGDHLVSARPPGGYRDPAHLAGILASLGYTASDLAAVSPHLDFSDPVPESPQSGPPWMYETPCPETHLAMPSVELATADGIVLEAIWRYLSTYFPNIAATALGHPHMNDLHPFMTDGFFFPEPSLYVQDPRTGPTPDGDIPYFQSKYTLFPDEAARLASQTLAWRAAHPEPSWNSLYAHLLSVAASADPVYPAIAPGDGKVFRSGLAPLHPVAHARWAQMKTDMAFAAVFPDPHPTPFTDARAWSGWGIDRGTGLAIPALLPESGQAMWSQLKQIQIPDPLWTWGPYDPADVYTLPADPFFPYNGRPVTPPTLSMRPPPRYSIASAGVSDTTFSWREAAFSAGTVLRFGSAEDLENLSGSPDLARRGVRALNDAVWPAPWGTDTRRRGFAVDTLAGTPYPMNRTYRHTAIVPQWDPLSFRTDLPVPPLPAQPDPATYYSRIFGALTLAGREGGPQGAGLYWPFGERDGDTTDVFLPEDISGTLRPLPMAPPDLPDSWPMQLWNPDCVVADRTTPFYATETLILKEADPGNPFPEGCPGVKAGQPVQEMTVSGWFCNARRSFSTPTCIDLLTGSQPLFSLIAERVVTGSGIPGALFSFDAGGVPTERWETADTARSGGFHFFAVTARRISAAQTDLHIFIDNDAPRLVQVPGELIGGATEEIVIGQVDELRLYDQALSGGQIRALYAIGRFVRTGSYVSPLYACDFPCTPTLAQWTGMVPPGYLTAGGVPVDPVRVTVTGYANPDGTGPSASAVLDASGVVNDLAALGLAGKFRSFRYQVDLDATPVDGPLLDTPVFESIWLSLSPPPDGTRGRWSGWSSGR